MATEKQHYKQQRGEYSSHSKSWSSTIPTEFSLPPWLSHEVDLYHPLFCLWAACGHASPAQTGRATYVCHDITGVKLSYNSTKTTACYSNEHQTKQQLNSGCTSQTLTQLPKLTQVTLLEKTVAKLILTTSMLTFIVDHIWNLTNKSRFFVLWSSQWLTV